MRKIFLMLCAAGIAVNGAHAQNIVLILSDDQGWTGSSVQMDDRVAGSVSDLYQTPNMERLAAEGMRFSNAYSPAPNCSPTRMSIQTGKTAARLGATDIIEMASPAIGTDRLQAMNRGAYDNKPLIVPRPVGELPDEEITIAEFLKDQNPEYATGHFGKWHMGGGSPERHGYDASSGLTTNNEGFQGEPDPKRSSEVTDQAIEFIRQQAEDDRPFFVQVSYYAVHTPVLAKSENIQRYKKLDSQRHSNESYAAMTSEMDEGVGRVINSLDELGLAEDTYVIFTSDNGGEIDTPVTTNLPLAKGKTQVWEGGVRVPLIVRGPGIAANTQSNVSAIGYDFLPTIADWIGAPEALPDDLDGGSLDAVLKNGGVGEVDRGTASLIWYYGAYRNFKHVVPSAAMRDGDYKLIWEVGTDHTWLYNLDADLSETTSLVAFQPERAESMHGELKAYLEEVGIEFPVLNPDYDPMTDAGLNPLSTRNAAAGMGMGMGRGAAPQ